MRRLVFGKFLGSLVARGQKRVDWETAVRQAEEAFEVQKLGRDGVFVGDTLYLWAQEEDKSGGHLAEPKDDTLGP